MTTCNQCALAPPPYETIKAAFSYQFPIDQLIVTMKSKQMPSLGLVLGAFIADYIKHLPTPLVAPDFLVPTPLYKKRLQTRGYNQSTYLAKTISHRLNIPIHHNLIQKQTATSDQKTLSAVDRQLNLQGSFSLNPKQQHHFKKRPIIAVVDDVVTTTATASEISRLLKKAGAGQVYIWTVARAEKKPTDTDHLI